MQIEVRAASREQRVTGTWLRAIGPRNPTGLIVKPSRDRSNLSHLLTPEGPDEAGNPSQLDIFLRVQIGDRLGASGRSHHLLPTCQLPALLPDKDIPCCGIPPQFSHQVTFPNIWLVEYIGPCFSVYRPAGSSAIWANRSVDLLQPCGAFWNSVERD